MFPVQTLILAFMALTGAVNAAAAPPARPVTRAKPAAPVFNAQTINCGSGAAPYCCSPTTSQASSGGVLNEGDQSAGNTCSKLSGSVQCNAMVICCNNAGASGSAAQSCSATVTQLQQPVIIA